MRAQKTPIPVAVIETVGEARLAHHRFDVGAPAVDQRADDAVGAARADGAEAAPTAAAQQPHDDRLRLVVERMAGRDLGAAMLVRQSSQRAVPQLPRPRFEVGAAAEVRRQLRAHERDVQRCCVLRRARLVALGVRTAQAMVDVRRHQLDVELRAQLRQRQEHAGGIRSARHGDQDAFGRRQQRVQADAALNHTQQDGERVSHGARSLAGPAPPRNALPLATIGSALHVGSPACACSG